MKLYYLDKYGWPVECIKGRWFLNFLRRLIHTRRVTTRRPRCLVTECLSLEEGRKVFGMDLEEELIKYLGSEIKKTMEKTNGK